MPVIEGGILEPQGREIYTDGNISRMTCERANNIQFSYTQAKINVWLGRLAASSHLRSRFLKIMRLLRTAWCYLLNNLK